MPLFPVIYVMAFFSLIDPPQTIVLFQVLSLVVKGLFAVLQDMNDALTSVESALSREQQANESRRAFLKYLFHEVRTPLNSLVIGVEVLQSRCQTDSEATESLQMMRAACQFMSSTLNDVLSMQRIEDGKFKLDMQPFAFSDVIETVFATFSGAALGQGVSLSSVLSPDVPARLLGDRFRLEHVLANLLSNAVKFSPSDGAVLVSVSLEAEEAEAAASTSASASAAAPASVTFKEARGVRSSFDNTESSRRMANKGHLLEEGWVRVTVAVTDEGPGISRENQQRLFASFEQIDAAALQKGGGSGLGLSLCREIVCLHGGTIGVTSHEGKGSCFHFTIPFRSLSNPSQPSSSMLTAPESVGPEGSAASRPVRALVVDGTHVRDILYLYLE